MAVMAFQVLVFKQRCSFAGQSLVIIQSRHKQSVFGNHTQSVRQ